MLKGGRPARIVANYIFSRLMLMTDDCVDGDEMSVDCRVEIDRAMDVVMGVNKSVSLCVGKPFVFALDAMFGVGVIGGQDDGCTITLQNFGSSTQLRTDKKGLENIITMLEIHLKEHEEKKNAD